MKRTITTLMVCVSAYALIAQEAFSLSSICRLSDQFTSVGLSTGYIAGRGSGPFTFQLRNSGFTFTMNSIIFGLHFIAKTRLLHITY